MPIHQQLWSLECSVIETVASLLLSVMEHCFAGIKTHCPDKVNDIQAVKKSSTDQCNSSGQVLFSADQWKKHKFFHSKKLRRLPSAFENRYLEWYSRSGEISPFDKLILGVCLLHPVFLSDILTDVVGVISKYTTDSTLYPTAKAILPRLHVFSKAENWGRFYDPPGICMCLW